MKKPNRFWFCMKSLSRSECQRAAQSESNWEVLNTVQGTGTGTGRAVSEAGGALVRRAAMGFKEAVT